MIVRAEVYAKPGELIQGELTCNTRFLLSNISSRIFKNTTTIGIESFNTQPLNLKSQQAVDVSWTSLSNKEKVIHIRELTVQQEGKIPVGKGMSSSSADVLGILK